MLEVTVKTLDGKNRSFGVPEEITVKEFKEKIAGSIEISADTQRLIFHGRVLQNDKKLNHYDVNGKTVHVVQSKPPSRTEASTNTSSPGASANARTPPGGGGGGAGGQGRGRGGPGGSNFVLGSFSVPTDVVDPNEVQNIVQQALSGMGDVGRNARVSTRSTNDGSSVDVHINLGQIAMPPPISESQHRIRQAQRMLRAARTSLNRLENPQSPNQESSSSMDTASPDSQRSEEGSTTEADMDTRSNESQSQPSETPPTRSPAPEGEGQQESRSGEGQEGASNTTSSERPRTGQQRSRPRPPPVSSLAELLQDVFSLNARLQPHLDRYHQLLESDPSFTGENKDTETTDAQRLFNHVSEIMHYISHAYHSISDLMVDFQRPSPRHLESAGMVATPVGVPINVADIARSAVASTGASTTPPVTIAIPTPATTQTQTNSTPGNIAAEGLAANAPFQDVTVDIGPNSVTINSVSAHVVGPRSATAAGSGTQPQTTQQGATTAGGTATTQAPPTGSGRPGAGVGQGGQPGGIPPDILQNIIQMATAAGARGHGPAPVLVISQGVATPTQIPPVHMPAPRMATMQSRPAGSGAPGPRGSTAGGPQRPRGAAFVLPRPPIPGLLPGGAAGAMDPFLPCHSRHFVGRRGANAAQSSTATSTAGPEQTLSGMVSNLVNSLVNQAAGAPRPPGSQQPASTTTTSSSSAGTATTTTTPTPQQPQPPPAFGSLFGGSFGPLPQQVGSGSSGQGQAVPPFLEQLRNLLEESQPATSSASTPSNTTPSTTQSSQSTTTGGAPAAGMSNEIFTQLVGGISSYVSQAALGQQPSDTVGDFLDRLGEQFGMSHGDPSFITDVFNCVSRHMTFVDLMSVFYGQGAPLQRIRAPLQQFLRQRVLEGREVTEENINQGVERLLVEMDGDIDSIVENERTKDDIDFKATLTEFLRRKMKYLIKMVLESSETDANFGTDLLSSISGALHELIILCRCCLEGGDQAVENMFQNRVRSISHDVNPMIQQWMIGMSSHQIRQLIPRITVTEDQVQAYVVRRRTAASPMDATSPQSSDASSYMSAESADAALQGTRAEETAACSTAKEQAESMEVGEMEEEKSTQQEENDHVRQKRPKLDPTLLEKVPLPPKHEKNVNGSVEIGSEDWHQVVPQSWVPVITRDVQTQSRQGYQTPHSDAYNSGMPAKRRKLSSEVKLTDMKTMLPETIKKTAKIAKATPSTSMEEVAEAAANSETLQAALKQEVTSAIRQRAQNDPDFIPGKFPSTEKLLEKE